MIIWLLVFVVRIKAIFTPESVKVYNMIYMAYIEINNQKIFTKI